MKKGKVFGKTQIALAIMVVALGTAIWLNMKYSTVSTSTNTNTSSKYLGQAEYVNAEVEQEEDIVNNLRFPYNGLFSHKQQTVVL